MFYYRSYHRYEIPLFTLIPAYSLFHLTVPFQVLGYKQQVRVLNAVSSRT
jgi:hypothetical protein